MIAQEKILTAFKRSLKHFGDDSDIEKLRISYKLDDVEVYSKEFNRTDYKNNSINSDRIYSDIEQIRRNYGVQIS